MTAIPSAAARLAGRVGVIAAMLLLVASACSDSGSGDAARVEVTGTDTSCELASDELDAGRIDFEFTNEADDVSELYVIRDNGDVVNEVENVTTGTSRTLSVDLVAGEYRVTCKPGQSGDGYSASFEVVGEGGTAAAEPDETITFDAHDFGYDGLQGLDGLRAGTTVRFEMSNSGDQPHEFEVVGPDGEPLGEVAAIEPGATGGATMTFADPGTYTFRCILVDEATGKSHEALGMVGTFRVS